SLCLVLRTTICCCHASFRAFFFNDSAPTGIYTLSLHDALPIYDERGVELGLDALDEGAERLRLALGDAGGGLVQADDPRRIQARSEEHTSELQSRVDLVCRLLLEKKKHKRRITAVP